MAFFVRIDLLLRFLTILNSKLYTQIKNSYKSLVLNYDALYIVNIIHIGYLCFIGINMSLGFINILFHICGNDIVVQAI